MDCRIYCGNSLLIIYILLFIKELDKSLQKKSYRILEDICSGSSEELRQFVSSNLATIQETLLLSLSSSSPSSKAVNTFLVEYGVSSI